jgi:hypothetical protein
VLPANYVLDPYEKSLDIDRSLWFLRMIFPSIDEARRRAYLLAALTYDLNSGLFVRLDTQEMLQDPFLI